MFIPPPANDSKQKGEATMSTQKTILITGATTGIGRTAALHFARAGHHVIATGRNEKALATLRDEGKDLRLDTVRLDVTDGESIQAAVRAVAGIGRDGVDVLVNNAGYGLAAALAEVTDADLRAQFETNVFGLMAVTRAFLPQMIARRSGLVMNISSVGGRVTFPLFGAYHASKYAVEALSDAMRNELAPFGIKVALIEPGPIATEFANRSVAEVSRYRKDTSPYAAVYARAEEIKTMTDKQSVPAERVARVMLRAVESRRPAPRYVVPISSRVMLWFLRTLPTRWSDAIMRRFLGLTYKRVAAAALPAAAV
jgi:short-subunit dehydrogenase